MFRESEVEHFCLSNGIRGNAVIFWRKLGIVAFSRINAESALRSLYPDLYAPETAIKVQVSWLV